MFSVLAAAAALYAFLAVGKIIGQISGFEAPAAIRSLELSRQAEQMVSAAPTLLTVDTEDERKRIWASFSAEVRRLDQMMAELNVGRGSGDISVDLIGWKVRELRGNLEELNNLVARRLDFDRSFEDLAGRFRKSYGNTQQVLSASTTEVEYNIEVSRAMAGGEAAERTGENTHLADLMAVCTSLQRAERHASTIYNAVLEAELAKQPDKYVGEAIVIFFGDPETLGVKEDALACVKMAIAMRRRMVELWGIWRDSGISKPLQCRIGINTGFCTVGNFGSEERMDYTIIGSGVNLASRLESAAPAGEILISHESYSLVKDQIHCVSAGTVQLRGISHPVETYRVVDLYTSLQRDREVIREDFPNFNLEIDLGKLSADEHNRAVATLQRALEKLDRTVDDDIGNAV